MLQKINEKIAVLTRFDPLSKHTLPVKIRWQGRLYTTMKLNYYHPVRLGGKTLHTFHITDGKLDFRLSLDSLSLNWTLEEVSDGLTD